MNNNNGVIGVIIGALLVVVIIIGVLRYQQNNKPEHSGGLYVGVTDATADIANVNDIDMSVKKVEVYNSTKGWVTVGSNTKTYSLLALKASGDVKYYAKENVEEGTYNKVRVTLGDATVRTKASGDVKATMPSSQIIVNTNIVIKENQDSHLKLDFLADKSLHAAAEGKYVFAPVVRSEARSNAVVKVASDDKLAISGGTIDSDTTVGVDLDGSSKANFQLVTDASLKIGASEGSTLMFMLGGKSYSSDSAKVWEDQSQGSANANINGIINANPNSRLNLNADGTINLGNGQSKPNDGSMSDTPNSADVNLKLKAQN